MSPVDGRVYVERPLATPAIIDEVLRTSRHAQASWRDVSIEQRAAVLTRFCDEFEKRGAKIAEETDLADGPAGPLRAPTKCAACWSARGT